MSPMATSMMLENGVMARLGGACGAEWSDTVSGSCASAGRVGSLRSQRRQVRLYEAVREKHDSTSQTGGGNARLQTDTHEEYSRRQGLVGGIALEERRCPGHVAFEVLRRGGMCLQRRGIRRGRGVADISRVQHSTCFAPRRGRNAGIKAHKQRC